MKGYRTLTSQALLPYPQSVTETGVLLTGLRVEQPSRNEKLNVIGIGRAILERTVGQHIGQQPSVKFRTGRTTEPLGYVVEFCSRKSSGFRKHPIGL